MTQRPELEPEDLRDLAAVSAVWSPILMPEDEALGKSLDFIALRLRRIADRLEDQEGPS